MQEQMLCLDSYALVELEQSNTKFEFLLNKDFVIPQSTLGEFYQILYKNLGKKTADYWLNKLSKYSVNINLNVWIKAVVFRMENSKENLSLFDCLGYIFAQENNMLFVTGDKQFKNKKGVMFIK